uniref:HERPUD family member 2 n=1 Tax=Scophthalmus maximus TaxID=52904 RepID=A0A8D3E039_SCOMX
MDPGAVDSPVTLVLKAPNQKYEDQTINCFLNWTVERLKSHISNVYPSKPWGCVTSLLHGKQREQRLQSYSYKAKATKLKLQLADELLH